MKSVGAAELRYLAEETLNEEVGNKVTEIVSILKAMSHEGRLQILYHLSSGEKSVTEIQTALSFRQAAASQQLSRLRLEGMISPRRDGKTIYYRISDNRVSNMLPALQGIICGTEIEK